MSHKLLFMTYSPLPWPVDGELVAAATESVQAHERLNRMMRTKLKEQPHSKQGTNNPSPSSFSSSISPHAPPHHVIQNYPLWQVFALSSVWSRAGSKEVTSPSPLSPSKSPQGASPSWSTSLSRTHPPPCTRPPRLQWLKNLPSCLVDRWVNCFSLPNTSTPLIPRSLPSLCRWRSWCMRVFWPVRCLRRPKLRFLHSFVTTCSMWYLYPATSSSSLWPHPTSVKFARLWTR